MEKKKQFWLSFWVYGGFLTFRCLFWLQAMKVNLIITDHSMPGMTGYELLKKIKVGHFRLCFTFVCDFDHDCGFLKAWNLEIYLCHINLKQESSAFREVPVVIMSSENILTRIDRYVLGSTMTLQFFNGAWFVCRLFAIRS